jgi:hypothetical protein
MGKMPVRLTVATVSAALCLIATGCGGRSPGTPHPVSGAQPPASSRSASAGPASPLPSSATASSPSASGVATSSASGSAPPVPGSTPPASTEPVFRASTSALTAAMRTRMTGVSWHPGCPVSLGQLRLLRLSYWGFDHVVHEGELIVNDSAAASLTQAFRQLFAAGFPIRQMRVVDDFGGDDERSMLADNTSAFNCRLVPGTSVWSQHAYGLAVDINPFENPEIQAGKADPPAAAAWADRSRSSPAMIRDGDAAWLAFHTIGWTWGGDWSSLKDYQHFSANGL